MQTNLNSITFGTSLTTIGDYAFQYRNGQTPFSSTLSFPDGLQTIGDGAGPGS